MPTRARTHRPPRQARRHKNPDKHERDKAYSRAPWRKLRAWKLATDPLCEHCRKRRIIMAASEVDHITPVASGGDFFDRANLQSLCKPCHSRKTNEDMRHATD